MGDRKAMKIYVNGIDVDCVIGDLQSERAAPQRIRVDVELDVSDRPSESDSLADAADYAEVARRVRGALVDARCRLVERAAGIAARTCMEFDAVSGVVARVTKGGAVPGVASVTAEACLRRR